MVLQDREKTMKQIQTFLDTKIAPKEFAAELKVLTVVSLSLLNFEDFNPYLVGEIYCLTWDLSRVGLL